MQLFPQILHDERPPLVLRRGDPVRAIAPIVLEAVAGQFRREPIRFNDAISERLTQSHTILRHRTRLCGMEYGPRWNDHSGPEFASDVHAYTTWIPHRLVSAGLRLPSRLANPLGMLSPVLSPVRRGKPGPGGIARSRRAV